MTWIIYFDCVNWQSGIEINGNIVKHNMTQRIEGYTIEVDGTFWYIYVASCLFLSGLGDKTQAFQAMVNYLRGEKMITIKVNDFKIEIYENMFRWNISVDLYQILDGQGASMKDARKQALHALEKYLDRAKNSIILFKTEYEAKQLQAFRWYLDHSFEDVLSVDSKFYFHEYQVEVGDWIFPELNIVMPDDVFQKLFKEKQ